MRRASIGLLVLALGALGTSACTKGQLVDVAMSGVGHVKATRGMRVGDRLVLAGDMHCHVLPVRRVFQRTGRRLFSGGS